MLVRTSPLNARLAFFNSMTTHFFDTDDAVKYGVTEAIILANIRYWIAKNEANERHFYNGRYWTYNSYKAFAALFPYLSESQIKRAIHNLEEKGAISSGNFNSNVYDKTKWYSLNRPFDGTISSNREDEIVQPIPYINTNRNKAIHGEIEKKEKFTAPKLQEVEEYVLSKGFNQAYAKRIFEYYDSAGWQDAKGQKVKNWKQKILGVWLSDDKRTQANTTTIKKFVNPLDEIIEWDGNKMTRREYNKIFGE